MKNIIKLILILIFINVSNLFCQEPHKNIGLSLGKSFSAASFATRIDFSGIINRNEFQIGAIITRFSEEPDYKKNGLKGLYLGYKIYPNHYKTVNLYFYLDNKFVLYNSNHIPTDTKYEFQYIENQLAKVKLIESLIGIGFDVKLIKRFKFFGDFGLGHMWERYKFDGFPDNPNKIDDLSAQLRFGTAVFLNEFYKK
jgi:hypothetical protein